MIRDVATILAHFRDPESPERAIARAMLRGHTDRDLETAARDLAAALRMPRAKSRLWHYLENAQHEFVAAGEERGLVPIERPGLGRVLVH